MHKYRNTSSVCAHMHTHTQTHTQTHAHTHMHTHTHRGFAKQLNKQTAYFSVITLCIATLSTWSFSPEFNRPHVGLEEERMGHWAVVVKVFNSNLALLCSEYDVVGILGRQKKSLFLCEVHPLPGTQGSQCDWVSASTCLTAEPLT